MINKLNWHKPTLHEDVSFQNTKTDTNAGASTQNERFGAVAVDATAGASVQ